MRTTKLVTIISVNSANTTPDENFVNKKNPTDGKCCSPTVNVVCFQNPFIPRFIFLPVTVYANFKKP